MNKYYKFVIVIFSFRFLRRNIVALLLFSFVVLSGYSQESQSWTKEHVNFSGYVKYLNSSTFQDLDYITNDNLIHNRLNLKVYLNSNFTTAIEVRNRVFWGNSVQLVPNYADFINNDLQAINLNVNLIDEPAMLIHSKIDRLYIDYQSTKWHVTIGRQRINWGKNLAWNPNDLFNTYNFFDFDYEERPGADALRVQYYSSGNSSIEAAINYTEQWDENTLAIKYNFHKFESDFQVLLAKYIQDYTVGIGWEGAIKNVGIKGEFSYFIPQESSLSTNDVFVGALSFDYYFKNGIATTFGSLFNSDGVGSQSGVTFSNLTNFNQTAKTLMPNKWSYFGQISKSITPAISTSLSSIYAYELKGVYIMPQLGYSLSQNWDFDLLAQVFYGEQNDNFENVANSLFLRFRWSY